MENRWLDDVDVDDSEARAEAENIMYATEESVKNRASALLLADVNADLSKDGDLYDLVTSYSESVLDYSKDFDGDYLDPHVHEIALGQDGEGESWIVKYADLKCRFLLTRDDKFYA